MRDVFGEVRNRLARAVLAGDAAGLLFSGGLDSSIIAALRPHLSAITVTLGSRAADEGYAAHAAAALGLRRITVRVDEDEAIAAIPKVIGTLGTFDPAVPNDLAVYFGLRQAKRSGIGAVMTGDGSDELFAGYSYMRSLGGLDDYLRRIARRMTFSSNGMGASLGIAVEQPFLDAGVVRLARATGSAMKIRAKGRKVFGKWVLRKAFEGMLPRKILWQPKRPLECGSGMSRLRPVIAARVDRDEYRENPYGIRFLNKEHLYYYKVYRRVVGAIPKPQRGEDPCPACGAGMRKRGAHCRVCGWAKPLRERAP